MAPREEIFKGAAGTSFELTAFKKFPTNYPHPTYMHWLNAKKTDDNVGPYWRIHNKLYDLTEFIDRHPGGKMWLEVTKGTDITEAFESAHITENAEKILSKFYVKDISTPRNSPYTFHEDGFYKTLKRKVRPILAKIGTGPSWKSLLIQDVLNLTYFLLVFASSASNSYILGAVAGMVLTMVGNCAHNYLHQRDNWRMYFLDLSFLSSHEFRVTHALSHHLYTNTAYDIEISALEPFWLFLPFPEKSFLQRYGSFFYELIIMPLMAFILQFRRIFEICTGTIAFRPEYALPYLVLFIMAIIAQSFWIALKLFLIIHATFSVFFLIVGLTAAHHHPSIFHDGDKMRDDTDWGLCQTDSVRDRMEVTGNLPLVLTTFGEHTLHHLLPTIDHSKLNSLYPAFFETCKEFNVPFSFMKWSTLFLGRYMQIANVTPNKDCPGYKVKNS